jgi:hypothetical protein
MAQATQQNSITRLSAMFSDPMVAEAFRRAERDCPPALVEADRPAPVLVGGNAVRALELA